MFRSLRFRNFRLFFVGQFLSLCGSWMQSTALAWLVYRLTRDPMMLGLTAFFGQFPVFLLGFYAGVHVDRTDRLRLVRATQALAMVQATVLAFLTWSGTIRLWEVLSLSLALGTINSFDMPARQVLIGELVDIEHRHNAIALNSTIVNGSRIFGPAIAGLAIGWIGEAGCFALNALSFLAVLLALFSMKDVRQAVSASRGAPWEEIGKGLAYATAQAPIRSVLLILTVFSLAGLPIYVLLPIFAEGVLHSGAKGLGILSSFAGFGATVGALVLARRASSRGLGPVLVQCLFWFAAGLVGLALSRSFPLSCACLFLVGWSAIQILAGANTLLQELSSDAFRGRIMGFYAMVFVGLGPAGSFMVGSLASRAGVTRTVLIEAAVCALLAAAYWRLLPKILGEGGAPPRAPAALPAPL